MARDLLPDLDSLLLLDAIARTGSITLAAGELGVTQQAASARLRRMESALGRRLVVRATRSSALTDDGAAVHELAQPVLQAAAEMEARLIERFAAARELRIAASMTVAEHFLPRWIGAYAAAGHPASSVRARTTNTREVVHLVAGSRVDLGFVEGDTPPAGLRHRVLAVDTLAVYVAPEHPWAHRHRISAWTLAGMPLVTREAGSGCRSVLLAALSRHGVVAQEIAAPALELESNTAVLEAASADVAPAVISTRAAQRYVDDGNLVPVSVEGITLHRDLSAIWREGDEPSSPQARAFLRAAASPAR